MTDRLSALLHEEADLLDVPMPAARETIRAGRRIRRRRTITRTVAVVAAVACIGTGAALLGDGPQGGSDPATDPSPSADAGSLPSDVGPVFATGDTVYLQAGSVAAQMDEVAQTLYYTSAGLLVRTNKDGASDGGAPFHFALVTSDGTVRKLGLTLGEVVPSTDPRQPYLAYADTASGGVQVVVVDVTSGAEAARVDVPGMADWGGWEAPPVALDGEDVFVGSQSATQVVNWRTGEVTTSGVVPGGYPDVHGGRAVVQDRREVRIVNARTGATILTVPTQGGYTMVRLSPDGRLATVATDPMPDTGGADLYTVDTGGHVRVAGDPYASGWTPMGQYYSVTEDGILSCVAGGDPCFTQPLPDGFRLEGLVRLGGVVYES
jgi:hypothetical protein